MRVSVQPEDVLPLFGKLFSRAVVKELIDIAASGQTMYWRVLTPLVVLWGMVYQRLNPDHSCDAYVSHLHSGAADELDRADPHRQPLSQRLVSESNAGYVQGRNRLPLAVLQQAWQLAGAEAQRAGGAAGRWQGHAVRLLDGTTFRLPPEGDLVESYGQSRNQHGSAHWVQARALLACDLFSQAAVGLAEADYLTDETELVLPIAQQEQEAHSLYLGDRHFGIYRVVQAFVAHQQDVLLRLTTRQAQALLQRNGQPTTLASGQSCLVLWQPTRHDQCFTDLPTPPIAGRLLYFRVQEAGFRPFDLYLFTTLLDEERYPTEALGQLYAQRWQVEIRFRHIKTALEMETFAVHSTALFRKELAAGLLTYNLVCILITQAAIGHQLQPNGLSFKRCLRRIYDLLTKGVPAHVQQQGLVADWLLNRLAKCRLPHQPNKVRHEPRQVRAKPRIYPTLKGDRTSARHQLLAEFAEVATKS